MKKLSFQRLKNIALFYLERYDASTQKLDAVLKRRLAKAKLTQEVPPESNQWIDAIVQEMQRLGYVNDIRFSENLVRRLSESGKSPSFIRQKLKLAGIHDHIIHQVLTNTNELEQARLMIKKKHLGNDFQKDLARLGRAGFSYEVAVTSLKEAMENNSTER